MKKKILKISAVVLVVAIMLCSSLLADFVNPAAAGEPSAPTLKPPETTANILVTYYGAVTTVVPLIVAWYGDNTAYLATIAGLFAIAAIIVIIFGVRRNKKGGDSR